MSQSPSSRRKPLVAAWYPQMGGYVGKCWLSLRGPDDCFVAYVFHDGEFPFDDGRAPRALHHCDARQFIAFGELVERLSKDAEVDG